MKNLYLIPTDKPSRLFNCFGKLEIGDYFTTRESLQVRNQHIYITNDEEIKERDWIFNEEREPSVLQCIGQGSLRGWKKIILTTDHELIIDGVQAIDDEFLNWFVNNSSCEEVEVESFCKNGDDCPSQSAYDKQHLCNVGYKIIMPKQEPKQEIVEERQPYWDLVDKKAEQNNTIDLDAYAKGIQDGVKWQQEDMIEKLEMHILVNEHDWNRNPQAQFRDFIEQFKNK
jgi:hypothetical protein